MSRDADRNRETCNEDDAEKTHPQAAVTPTGMFAPTIEWQQSGEEPKVTESATGDDSTKTPPNAGQAEPSLVPPSTYVVAGEVARGGLGRILKAYDRRLGRSVALKELIRTSPELTGRLLREALITAHLQHPSIVPVYEAGYWTTGAPFYAMKLVSGRSLQELIEQARTLAERLALLPNMIAVVEAIAYAHSEGIIHRDLKPANVLVGAFGETVVVDWGLAKSLSEAGDSSEPLPQYAGSRNDLTVLGSVIGTPAYMAPEQARGAPADQRGDVYALGAMLYQLLAGAAPYAGESGERVLQRVSAGSAPRPLEELEPLVPPDLLTVVTKAMAPKAPERYPTAAQLAADLKRFQTGQLVSAHAYSTWSLFRRWISRHRGTVTVAIVLLTVLAATAAVSVKRIVEERNRAEARTNEMILIQSRSLLETDPSSTIAWLKTYPASAPAWGAVRTIAADALQRGIAKRVLRGHRDQIFFAVFTPDGKRVAAASADKTLRVWDLESGDVQVLSGHDKVVTWVAASPDNRTLASASSDNTIRLWDVVSATQRVLTGHTREVWHIDFSPDGKLLASASSDQTIRVWDTATGRAQTLAFPSGEASKDLDRRQRYVAFSPNGKSLVSTGYDGTVWLWDIAGGAGRLLTRHKKPATVALFSPDGKQVLTCSEDGTMQLWDLASEQRRELIGHTGTLYDATFSADGSQIASAGEDGTIRLWDAQGRSIQTLSGHQGAVTYVSFSADGQLLASGGTDGTVRLWNLVSGEKKILRGHTGPVSVVQFSPVGRALLSASWDNTARLWELKPASRILFQGTPPMRHAVFSSKGHLLAFGGDDAAVRLWDASSDRVHELRGHEKRINRLAFSPEQDSLASASDDGTVRLWQLPEGPTRVFRGHQGAVTALSFSTDGKALISAGVDKTVRVWERWSGTNQVLSEHKEFIDDLAISPDGTLVATAEHDKVATDRKDAVPQVRGIVQLRNLKTEKTVSLGHERRVYHIAFSPDGRWLASGSDTLRLWDVQGGTVKVLNGHDLRVVDLAFFNRNRLVSGAWDKRLIVWDLSSGASSVFVGHPSPITALDAAPDGRRLVSASWDAALNRSNVRIWDIDTHESRVLPGNADNTNEVKSLTFSPDGTSVVAASSDGSIRLWRDDLPSEPNALHAWMLQATDATVEK